MAMFPMLVVTRIIHEVAEGALDGLHPPGQFRADLRIVEELPDLLPRDVG